MSHSMNSMKEARRNFHVLDEAGKRVWHGCVRRCFIHISSKMFLGAQ